VKNVILRNRPVTDPAATARYNNGGEISGTTKWLDLVGGFADDVGVDVRITLGASVGPTDGSPDNTLVELSSNVILPRGL
jgi:hypothetical protein